MRRWVWLVGLTIWLWPHGSWAKTTEHWLYRADPVGVRVGQPVAGPGRWREISSPDVASLSWQERQTLQPDIVYHGQFVPNDPDFSQQWNLAAINIPAAWDADHIDPVHGGDPRVIVAVLDTGLATAAPDFANLHLWTNSS